MYISFLGGYSCLASLPYAERLNVKNYHPHAMGPMGCDMRTVMGVMGSKYRKLEDGLVYSNIRSTVKSATGENIQITKRYRLVSFDMAILGKAPVQLRSPFRFIRRQYNSRSSATLYLYGNI